MPFSPKDAFPEVQVRRAELGFPGGFRFCYIELLGMIESTDSHFSIELKPPTSCVCFIKSLDCYATMLQAFGSPCLYDLE